MRQYGWILLSGLLGGLLSPLRAQAKPDFKTFLCYQSASLGSEPTILVDLLLRFDMDGNRLPTTRDSAAVMHAGGEIVHSFNAGMLRARLDTVALRPLLISHAALVAYPVIDATNFEISTQVIFSRSLVDQDTAAIARLGGRDMQMYHGRIVNAILPDSVLPSLKGLSGVAIVQALPTACGEW